MMKLVVQSVTSERIFVIILKSRTWLRSLGSITVSYIEGFVELFGVAPMQFITRTRIEAACDDLLTSKKEIISNCQGKWIL